MSRLWKLVAFAGVAYPFHSGTGHILCQTDDVGVLAGPVAALPQFSVRPPRDDLRIPGRAAALCVVVVIRKSGDAVIAWRLLDQGHHGVVASDALIDLGHGRITGVLSAI